MSSNVVEDVVDAEIVSQPEELGKKGRKKTPPALQKRIDEYYASRKQYVEDVLKDLGPGHRLEDESFEDYKKRRKARKKAEVVLRQGTRFA